MTRDVGREIRNSMGVARQIARDMEREKKSMNDQKAPRELLACPFCGGKADPTEVVVGTNDGKPDHHEPGCTVCSATTPTVEAWNRRAESAAPAPETPRTTDEAVIDMVLHCPACGLQHIDEPEKVSENRPALYADAWTNPLHRSHLCLGCGHIWRPADVPTNGVAAVKTIGKADSPIAAPRTMAAQPAAWNGRCPGESRDCEAPECCAPGNVCFRNDEPLPAAPVAQADAQDAARYRWLREQSHPWGNVWFSLAALDSRIDKAIAAQADRAQA